MNIKMLIKSSCLLLLFVLMQNSIQAQQNSFGRQSILWNSGWEFVKDSLQRGPEQLESNLWSSVQIPHSWNTDDVRDDVPGYYRGMAYYKKKLPIAEEWKGKDIVLHFEGANQETTVYVNGRKVGTHIGGYNGFNFTLNPFIDFSKGAENEVVIAVTNAFNKHIPPLTADFTFFGGIYRNVKLNILPAIHFSDDQYGSQGVYVSGIHVQDKRADLAVRGQLKSPSASPAKVKVLSVLKDHSGRVVARKSTALMTVEQTAKFDFLVTDIKNPKLWSPEQPYLYEAITQLLDQKNKVIDEIRTAVGFRYFSFDPAKGFFLNGQPYKLIGASRHQDYDKMGNAVPDVLQVQDLTFLKEMGGNFLRVAHYPQSPAIMRACDSLGILTSVEIPVVNEITESEEFTKNALHMQKEMIYQNFNYTSVIIWAYMNEVLLRTPFNQDKPRQQIYYQAVNKLAQQLDDLTRQTDSTRYTMLVNHGNFDQYHQAGLNEIPMIVGWNLYPGWYGGEIKDINNQLDRIHERLPHKPLLLTEYGADADPRIHSFSPIRFDKSIEYAIDYHIGYLNAVLERPFVAGAFAWNLSDFNSETREESMPHINNKGLLTIDRKVKNSYLLYQAYFRKEPFLKIGTALWESRAAVAAANAAYSLQEVDVYTNAEEVELYINDTLIGKNKVVNFRAQFQVPWTDGINNLRAKAVYATQTVEDQKQVQVSLLDNSLQTYFQKNKELRISLGENRYYVDLLGQHWIPDEDLHASHRQVIGGENLNFKKRGPDNLGSESNILNTYDDPIFQTQRVGMDSYNLFLPAGNYELDLYFAELMGLEKKEKLPYDLEIKNENEQLSEDSRVFDVYFNGSRVLEALNIADEIGKNRGLIKRIPVQVSGNQGLKIEFKSKAGKAVLNAIAVYKK